MRPTRRYGANKRKSARKFRKQTQRTARANIYMGSRGGIRL